MFDIGAPGQPAVASVQVGQESKRVSCISRWKIYLSWKL